MPMTLDIILSMEHGLTIVNINIALVPEHFYKYEGLINVGEIYFSHEVHALILPGPVGPVPDIELGPYAWPCRTGPFGG